MNNDVVILQLDRPRTLKFGHTSLKTLVELTGKSLEEIDDQLDLNNFEFIEQMAYCGLLKDAKDHHEVLTLEQIPELLDEAPSHFHVCQKVVQAWRVAFGVPAQAPEGNGQAPVGEIPAKEELSTGTKASE